MHQDEAMSQRIKQNFTEMSQGGGSRLYSREVMGGPGAYSPEIKIPSHNLAQQHDELVSIQAHCDDDQLVRLDSNDLVTQQ